MVRIKMYDLVRYCIALIKKEVGLVNVIRRITMKSYF